MKTNKKIKEEVPHYKESKVLVSKINQTCSKTGTN